MRVASTRRRIQLLAVQVESRLESSERATREQPRHVDAYRIPLASRLSARGMPPLTSACKLLLYSSFCLSARGMPLRRPLDAAVCVYVYASSRRLPPLSLSLSLSMRPLDAYRRPLASRLSATRLRAQCIELAVSSLDSRGRYLWTLCVGSG
jgi:hypothetical protein